MVEMFTIVIFQRLLLPWLLSAENIWRTYVLFVWATDICFELELELLLTWVSKPGWILLLACFIACAQCIPQIHLWWDTC